MNEKTQQLSEAERIRRGILSDGRQRVVARQGFQKLYWPEIPGKRLYWANDTPGWIEHLMAKGYEHVHQDGKPVTKIVGKTDGGQGQIAYLLCIAKEWYDEDVLKAETDYAKDMQRIREGKLGKEGQYVPDTGIKVVRTGANIERR